MSEFDALPDSWTIWNESPDQCILVFRPDVFDSHEFPAPCLPTLYLTHGQRSRRPGSELDPDPTDPWVVTLFLEPEVNRDADHYDARTDAVEGTIGLAERFADGEIDYRELYQVPREEYFEKLDELTGE
ncbi:DUF5820 family protein [Halococcus thailandensis]|uniref:Uncharacterized protein n=1 Tax=Halococcus thailandensis JCM 13552 TaxID=1227457 RepID=M0N5F6_9EURY|nr:DUF5820 family protein [Halococcus thailandensis]EMA51920.1 hypothetical protein C451_13039 [Halococcus thailandensis JCM 13552]